MKKNDDAFIKHIIEAADKIESYTDGISFDDFVDDDMCADAVVRQLEIIGEAVKNISNQLKSENKAIAWKEMAGMRDKLIHGYFGVDLGIVWNTCKENIPPLKKEIKKLLLK